MLVPKNIPQEYKENSIWFSAFYFGEGVNIIDWLENMKVYVSDIEGSYKDTIIGNLGNAGTSDLLLHIVQCWIACVINE